MRGMFFNFKNMHEILHILGFCGEKHPSIVVVILEWHNLGPMFNYIKTIFK
jgi:hypothetical protein